jgi:hypothetical protein
MRLFTEQEAHRLEPSFIMRILDRGGVAFFFFCIVLMETQDTANDVFRPSSQNPAVLIILGLLVKKPRF